MNDGTVKILIAVFIGFILFKTCNNARREKEYRKAQQQQQQAELSTWKKSPVDELIKSLSNENTFSIILFDMDVEDPNSSKPKYKHQYRVVIEKPDTVIADETDWKEVSASYFKGNLDNMGMEIASKKDGVVSKQAAPAGYNNYVGNPQYGHWVERNGSSFWEFYGKFAFMSTMFNLMTYPARMSYWNDYRNNYYGTGRGYYGPSGQRVYGTKSYTSSAKGQTSNWGNKSSAFKSNVRSSVSRSTSASSSRSYSSSSSYNKTTRSSTRSSYSSSYRSRSGGGYGK